MSEAGDYREHCATLRWWTPEARMGVEGGGRSSWCKLDSEAKSVAESRGEGECADVYVGVKMEGPVMRGTTTMPASGTATKRASSNRVQPYFVTFAARFPAHAPTPISLLLLSSLGVGLDVLRCSTQVARVHIERREVHLSTVCVACDGCT